MNSVTRSNSSHGFQSLQKDHHHHNHQIPDDNSKEQMSVNPYAEKHILPAM